MEKGVIIRFEVHKILYDIYKLNKYYDINLLSKKSYNKQDIAFINNVCLNSMRFHIHAKKIILKFSKKKPKINEFILLTSAITQIVFLDFKDYAVTYCSVEIAKKLKIYHGYVNAILKKIILNKDKLRNIKIKYNELPTWFVKLTSDIDDIKKKKFLDNYYKEPSLHIMFKKEKDLLNFEKKIFRTSKYSGFVKEKLIIENINSYKKGTWWVQDFSSSFPLNNISDDKLSGKNIDLCSAPGGKTFQIINRGKHIIANDQSLKRLNILEKNLKRLKFKTKVNNYNFLKQKIDQKYDFIILDAPCSAVGTIRRNPEIFFKSKSVDIIKLTLLQKKMLQKASEILNKNGVILYMVCSFLEIETFIQIKNFLNRNKDFSLEKFNLNINNTENKILIHENCMYTLPAELNSFKIDGYFAAYIKKN